MITGADVFWPDYLYEHLGQRWRSSSAPGVVLLGPRPAEVLGLLQH
jgi:hypothetical protein